MYGSLYPWDFEAKTLPASPLYILLHSWDVDPTHVRFLFDVALNIAIYIPLGASAYLAFRRSRTSVRLFVPVAIGAALSACVEMAQLYTPHRQCSAIDLVDNILGSALGVVLGIVFSRVVGVTSVRVRDRNAVALLFVWVAFLVYPFFPVLWIGVLRTKLSALFHGPFVDPIPTLLSAAEWLAVGRLIRAAGARSPMRWLVASFFLIALQVGIVNRNPQPSDFEGAALAAILFLIFKADLPAAIFLISTIALRGLAPFHFGTAQAFIWIPFAGLLGAEWQHAIPILLGKLFQYGAAIWLFHRSGLSLLRSTTGVAILLALIEALQTRIPGHVPEINDPLLAVLLGLAFQTALKTKSRGGDGPVARHLPD